MFGGIFGGFDRGGNSFQASYRCFPVSFIDKLNAENGDKVFLPPSALDRLGMSFVTQIHQIHTKHVSTSIAAH